MGQFFLQWPNLLQEILSQVSATQNEVCKGAMASWSEVLGSHPRRDNDIAEGSTELWDIAEKQLLPLALKNLTSKPFPDVRESTWRLLAELVAVRSIAQRMLTAAEMRDLLLDFTSEQNSQARIGKHDFVTSLVNHHGTWLGAFLDETVERLLTEYARQGPHWVPRDASALVSQQTGG